MIDVCEVTKKLIGAVEPIGETTTDGKRLENLRIMIVVMENLLIDLHGVSEYRNCHEYSMKKAGDLANVFLQNLKQPTPSPPTKQEE